MVNINDIEQNKKIKVTATRIITSNNLIIFKENRETTIVELRDHQKQLAAKNNVKICNVASNWYEI